MPGRNDPCPCGSGKKYKHCHQREDDATPRGLRLMQGGSGAGGKASGRKLLLPPGEELPTDFWEADLVPFAAEIDDDPAARPTILMVGAGDFVLRADILSHPPSEASEVAQLLADVVGEVCAESGKHPTALMVRLEVLRDEVAERLGDPDHPAHGARVGVSHMLPRLDDALAQMEQHSGVPRMLPGSPHMSNPRTWAGWGFAPDDTGKLFEAAAAYFRAAPWEVLENDDVLTLRLRDGSVWALVVLGAAGEFIGLALHEDVDDLMRILDGPADEEQAAEGFPPMRGVVLSLGFDTREFVAKSMRDEIKKAKWPVASPAAYPHLTALNTPGAGITTRQLHAVTAALLAAPGFVEKHSEAIIGTVDARFPLRYTDKATGASVEMSDSI